MSMEESENLGNHCKTVFDFGKLILDTSSSELKSKLTLKCVELYKNGEIKMGDETSVCTPRDVPARPLNVKILQARQMPKRGKGGSLKNRIALIHSFCHIESYAIDLSWDILMRAASFHIKENIISDDNKNNNNNNSNRMAISDEIDILINCFEINDFEKFKQIHNNSKRERKMNGNHGVVLPIEFYQDWLRVALSKSILSLI